MRTIPVEVLTDSGYSTEQVEIDEAPGFAIDENNIEGELCEVGSKLHFYGSLTADLKAEVARKKLELDSYDSEFALSLRKSGEKMTEGHIKERTKVDLRHKELLMEVIEAERNQTKIENLYKSQVKRADCVISLAYSQRKEINNY